MREGEVNTDDGLMNDQPMDSFHPAGDRIAGFLALSIDLATALHQIHQQRKIHAAINPATILLETDPTETAGHARTRILEPGLATNIGAEAGHRWLAYVSPEQTGRMNRAVDQRTDLYSLGAVFYQLLTGQPPFTASDSLVLVHAIIATPPTPPDRIRPDLPLPISDIVVKLLAKDPRDRYQSAEGLRSDLETCLARWQTTGRIDPFALGRNDVPDSLLLPQSLYGRRHELDWLIDALNEACSGCAQLLWLAGDSGIGKTALVGELMEPVLARGGTLISDRIESHRQTIPYAASISALEDFVCQLLAKDPVQTATWRDRLTAALSGHAAQLVRVIPDLGLIVEVAPVPDSPAEASDPRILLNLALRSFLRAIAAPGHPLVVFLDDAQWADADSLQLLHDLTSDSSLSLLVICAYRTDEGLPEHIQRAIVSVSSDRHRVLAPLGLADTRRFLADALHMTPEQVGELAVLIHGKTAGNAFFVREFLRSLHDQGLVSFDPRRRAWHWDLARIQATPVTDNVVELVRGRLEQLPARAQRTLRVAAIMGSQFERDQLAAACQQTPAETDLDLRLALGFGAIAPSATTLQTENESMAAGQAGPRVAYVFPHEQIREAARLLQPSLAEETIHWQIGRGLLQSVTIAQRQEHSVMLARHLNRSSALLAGWSERVELAEINLQASRQAAVSAAYDNALSLARCGLELLTADPRRAAWQEAYDLMRDLHLAAGQAASRIGQFEQADQLFDIITQHAISVLDHATVTLARLFGLYLQGKHTEAVAEALHALRQLGVRLPQTPRNRHVVAAMIRTRLAMLGRRIEALVDLPPMTDERSIKAMEILAAATISAASVAPKLLMIIGLEIVWQSVKHGFHPLSAVGYALHGLLLCGVTGQINPGYAFGQLALRLLPQIRAREYRVFVKYFVYAHVSHWKEPIADTLQPVRDISTTGEFEYLAVAAGLYSYFAWCISGLDLSANEQAIAEDMHLLEPFQNTPLHYRYQLGLQYYQNLLGRSDDPCCLVGGAYDERQLLPVHQRENDRTTIFYLACHKLTLCFLFGEYDQAQDAARLAAAYRDGGIGTPLTPVLYFYDSLAHLARYPTAHETEANHIRKMVAANQRKMRRWARLGPANCLHRYTLVEAERARVTGDHASARELYDAAIGQAQEHNYLPELAVAHELAARFYLAIDQPAYAETHLRAAHKSYQTWGALGKVRQLEGQHRHLFTSATSDGVTGLATLSTVLDMASALKAAQVLSSETAPPKLMDKLTSILIENAGAQYGYLLLPDGNRWRVAAGRSDSKAGEEAQPDQPAVAFSIVQQVARSHEPFLLNDVAAARPFIQDPHVLTTRPQSILCLPLLDQSELVGVFYMENRLTRDAFPPERLQPLTMLATQAAIALKNASLVTGLHKAQEEVLASEQRFRLLFENAPLGIFEIDISEATPRIRAANRRAEAVFGWSAAELSALDPAVLVPDESRHEIHRLVETVRAGKTAYIETTNLRRDGSIFPVRIIATPARDQRGLHMIVAVEDITAQRQRRSEAEAIDEERRRIAQEIHDGVAQDLAALRLKLSLWRDWVAADPDRMQSELDQTQDTLDAAIDEIRRSIYALRPLALNEVGLLPALRRYVADFNEEHEVYVELQIDLSEERLPAALELPLFRTVQEGLNNIARHAEASLVRVRLETHNDDTVILTIRDNGQGFDVSALDRAGRTGHLGLIQMRERVEQEGGELTVASQPGQGTEIRVQLPLS